MGLLKKVGNVVKSVVSKPQNLLFPTTLGVTDGIMQASSGKGLFEATPGPANPFSAMPNGFLGDTSRLDFLKDNSKYDFLKDNSKFDFLKNTGQYDYLKTSPELTEGMKTFADSYRPPTGVGDSRFSDYLGNINAPSSVDAVRGEIDSDTMARLLEGVDTDTKNSIGSLKSDFLDRGLSGPGMISDIEGNALAQAYGDAGKTKAGIRGEYAGKELDRMKAKEDAVRAAYGERYGAGVNEDTQGRQIAAAGAQSDATGYNDLLKSEASLKSGRDLDIAKLLQGDSSTLAALLNSRDSGYADQIGGRENLFAQLLNARDLGMAGINSSNYNSAAGREQAGKKPSLFDQLFDKVNIGIGI